jgi:hypothetical protein
LAERLLAGTQRHDAPALARRLDVANDRTVLDFDRPVSVRRRKSLCVTRPTVSFRS